MAKWTQPVKEQHTLVEAYIRRRHRGAKLNLAVDAHKRIVLIEMPGLSKKQLGELVADLRERFPGAFS